MAQRRQGLLSSFVSSYESVLTNPNHISGQIVRCDIRPAGISTADLPATSLRRGSTLESSKFLIEIIAKFTRSRAARERAAAGRDDSINVHGRFCLQHLPIAPQTTRLARFIAGGKVRDMLACVHVPRHLPGVGAVVDKVLECCCRTASGAPQPAAPGRVFRVTVKLDVLVDELPPYALNERIRFLGLGRGGVDRGPNVRFVAASEEAIAGLEKVRVGVSEKECVVCLEDILVGSEATGLPCSHQFHGDCIIKWLNISKFCPLCRFELPS